MTWEAVNWETWGPPVFTLLVAIIAALVLALRFKSDPVATPEDDDLELGSQKDILVDQIRDLDADRHKLDDAEYSARREALVNRAAAVLRAQDKPADDPKAPLSTARSRGGLGWAAGALALFLGLGFAVTQYATPREDGGMTGGGGMTSEGGAPPTPAATDPAVVQAQQTLEQDPNNLEALNILTNDALARRDVQGAMALLDRARAIAPEHPEVLTHLAILQISVGMFDRAKGSLESALAADRHNGKALIWLGVVAANTGDEAGAKLHIEQALALPNTPADLKGFANRMLLDLSGEGPPQQTQPAPQQTQPPQTQASGEARLAGTVTLSGVEPQGTLFVVVRRGQTAAGPPVAAKKVPAPQFPHSFSLMDSDMMLGGTWPDQVWVEARLDGDGNVMTKDDVIASSTLVGPIPRGGTIELRLE